MKRLLIAIALLTGLVNAQNYLDKGNAFILYDSLWNDIYVPDTVAAQTFVEIPLNYQYEWLNLTAIDSGTTYDDSIMVEYPIYKVRLTSGKMAVRDTVWQPVQFIRDSSWTNISGGLLVDDNSTKSYQIFVANYPSIRIRMINATLVENRVFWFIAQANRKY